MSEAQQSLDLDLKPMNPCPKCGRQLTTIAFKNSFTGEHDHKTIHCTVECGYVRYE